MEQKLKHVYRLQRYLPFDPSHEQIYEEYQSSDAIDLDTKAIDYLKNILDDSSPKLVILTGDAGHGKTFICRKVITDVLNYSEDKSRELLRKQCDGSPIQHKTDHLAYPIKIYKDFSEFRLDRAPKLLEQAVLDREHSYVICVNEGHLRAVLSKSDNNITGNLTKHFYNSFETGEVASEENVHIINLNYQSVCSDDTKGLVRGALDKWLHANKWQSCQECSSRDYCPIYKNFLLLRDEKLGEQRRQRIESVFSLAEKLGTVITIREMLMSLAYMLTGGLVCEDVHKKLLKRKEGWQYSYMYYQLLFTSPPTLSDEQVAKIHILPTLSLMDPGKVAKRSIDEKIINFPDHKMSSVEMIFIKKIGTQEVRVDAAKGIDDVLGNAQNRTERQDEVSLTNEVVAMLRRKDFFDTNENSHDIFKHLGFSHANDFFRIINGDFDDTKMVEIKNRFITGLHIIQGLRITVNPSKLYLIDPAYGYVNSNAAIVANEVSKGDIRLLKLSQSWTDRYLHMIYNTVDWSEREIVFSVKTSKDQDQKININLLLFDTIMRASSGYIPKKYYAHDLRKLKNFLAKLTEKLPKNSDNNIRIFNGMVKYSIVIEGDVIEVDRD